MPVKNQRLLQDASFTRTKNLPPPGRTVFLESINDYTTSEYFPIDLITEGGGLLPEEFAWQLVIPATLLNDVQSLTFELLHSDDPQGPYSSLEPSITATITGAGGVGTAAETVVAELPIGTKQYLICSAHCSAGADVSGRGFLSMGLLF